MHEHPKPVARRSFIAEAARQTAIKAVFTVSVARANDADAMPHVEIKSPSPSKPEIAFDLKRTALVVIDPRSDLLNLEGAAYPVPGGSELEHKAVRNFGRLCRASKHAGIAVGVSLTSGDLGGANSGFIPELKQYIEDGKTIVCAPHETYSPLPFVNDIGLRLRKLRVNQIILAGLIVNLRLKSHLRDFLGQGFDVAVVRDAIAGPNLPEGGGYLSALINFRRIANALWTTDETIKRLGQRSARALSARP